MTEIVLTQLFDFLKSNRQYNKEVQEAFYRSIILPYKSPNDKIVALLHHVANTQSQPNIDRLFMFYKSIQKNYDSLSNFHDFVSVLTSNNEKSSFTYLDVFESLHEASGWGKKTAALLVKSVYHLHNGNYSTELRIWKDAPLSIGSNELFYLPVDAVIQFIFKELEIDCRYDFEGINKYLHKSGLYPGEMMEVWDDLWFWGFITQKIVGGERTMVWNESKYWALLHTNKSQNIIAEIKLQANILMNILRK